MGPRDAVRLIPDGAVVGLSGLGANQRASIMYWAMREMYEETGRPRDLTVIIIGGHGGRGIVPGTVEELGVEGLCTRFITGHTETFKAMLRLADTGKLELQCLPQGTLALLLDAMTRGEDSLVHETGVGTFMDPRCGRGSPVLGVGEQYVSVEDGKLRYRCPKINVAVFNAPAADRKGNIYVRRAAMIGESYEIAKAAKRNGGIVIANVGLIVEEGYDKVFLPAEDVDAIVYYPWTEQSGSMYHRKPSLALTLESKENKEEVIAQLRFINDVLRITPRRSAADWALARLAAGIFAAQSQQGDRVDIGVGLPEEVARLLYTSGITDQVTLLTESGVFGGIPAPGIFFGAAVNPTEIVSSAEAFKRIYQRLDSVILGVLQVDGEGNVNVSKRGEGAINYVGPGGFIDLTACAKKIFFCSSWGAFSDIAVNDGKVLVKKAGMPKFVEKVDEVTFSGAEGLRKGKTVFYITHVGAFQLTERGVMLYCVMPGIDVRRDILEAVPMRIVLPPGGKVPVVAENVVTGNGFRLRLGETAFLSGEYVTVTQSGG